MRRVGTTTGDMNLFFLSKRYYATTESSRIMHRLRSLAAFYPSSILQRRIGITNVHL